MREHVRANGYGARHYKETVKYAEVGRHLITYRRNYENAVLLHSTDSLCSMKWI